MRNDMAKVIVERPRLGGYGARKGRSPRDPDLLPKHQGLRRAVKESSDFKHLNETLQPLRRFLHSQVGRPWDKVWSEICANLRPTSTVQQHVRDHVFDFVAVRGVRWLDGEVFVEPHQWGGPLIPLKGSRAELWVDPRTGILRKNRYRRSCRAERAQQRRERERDLRQRMRVADDDLQYHLLSDGGWWAVRLGQVPMVERPRKVNGKIVGTYWAASAVRDVVLDAHLSNLPREKLYDRHGVYAVDKRQLSKREIRQLGLR